MRSSGRLCLILLSVAAFASPALATSPNFAVCTAGNTQQAPVTVSDGAGGAIVAWHDVRNGADLDIYVQHVLPYGGVDPAWPANGLAVCTLAENQYWPAIVSDGAGGAIITWQDQRGGTNYDLYAQHVLASGAVDGAWPADGRALCTVTGREYPGQTISTIVADGAGGAIVTWSDYRDGNASIYAQRVLASGAVAWPTNGRLLSTALSGRESPKIVSDGAGGAIVAWNDYRNINWDIYAQHVHASGLVDVSWPANGRAVCAAAGDQGFGVSQQIVSDGTGGAIITWSDSRAQYLVYDIYAQRIRSSGTVDPAWPADGRAVCSAAHSQTNPTIVSDGAGGAIVAWEDGRGWYADIYAQHVLASGALDAAWPVDGRALCTADSTQNDPEIASDGAGGAIVTWQDNRTGIHQGSFYEFDIFAQHVLASGALNAAWPANGLALATAVNSQEQPKIVSDGAGSAIVTWHDYRGWDWDIYAQKVTALGPVGVEKPNSSLAFALPLPNPAALHTTLQFTLPRAGMVRLGVYDAAGRLVRELASGTREAGQHSEAWNLRDGSGRTVGAGLYFARLVADGRTLVRRVAVTR